VGIYIAGMAPMKIARPVLRGTSDPPEESDLLRRLEEAQLPHLLLRQQNELVLLLPAGKPSIQALDDDLANLAGSSSPFRPGEPLDIPRREARRAVARAIDAGRPHMAYGDEDSAGRWLPEDVHAREALVNRVLGAAIAYDTAHDSDIIASLRTWMERDRRTDDAAHALQVRPNTLAYRLKRSHRSPAATSQPPATSPRSGWLSPRNATPATRRKPDCCLAESDPYEPAQARRKTTRYPALRFLARFTGHQRKAFSIKRLVGASSVVCPCWGGETRGVSLARPSP
jgi:hypothetical protein